jgi:DNA polymerase
VTSNHILERPRIICDFETYSDLDVRDVGAWRYAEHESTEILCLSYGYAGQKKNIWTPGMEFPQFVIDHINAGHPIEAHNCQFERAIWFNILSAKFGVPNPRCWIDTMASCAYRGLPLGLDEVGSVLDLPVKKDKEGKALIQKLCKPRKPTKKDPSTRNRDPDLLQKLYDYCIRDSEAEDMLGHTIGDLTPDEFSTWVMDQRINRRGVYVDMEAVLAALHIVNTITENLESELQKLTKDPTTGEPMVKSGSEVAKIGAWCETQGVKLPNLQAGTVEDFIKGLYYPIPDNVKRVLEIRQQLSRASAKKLIKFRDCTCVNGRIHGLLQYHGAGTGRWAGRLVQPQNFPRGSIKDIDLLIATIKLREADILALHYGDPMEAIASALRGMFIATPGKTFYVADFAAIEARVVMWLAGQMDALEAFAKFDRGEGPDIYCVTASKIYKRPIDKKKDPDERQLGKITVLGCFGPETKVLTDHGVKAIVDVSTDDRVWDGIEWVRHQGVVDQGLRETIDLMGVDVTPEHRILVGPEWVPAITVAGPNGSIRCRALETGSENLPSSDSYPKPSIFQTDDKSGLCKEESKSLKRVYDIALAGPRNRFTIITGQGPLIVHNCGYQMSGPKLQQQALDSYGVEITLDMANLMVATFRGDYAEVPMLWKKLEDGAAKAIRFKRTEMIRSPNGVEIVFAYETDKAGNWLSMQLPNGRKLWYFEPGLEPREVQYTDKETGEPKSFTKDSIYYQGRNNKKGGAWGRVYTYGGMLTENAVQAIARDLMVAAMRRVEKAGFEIVMSVHDEVVAEAEPGRDIHEFEKLVAGPNPAWAKGCPVAAEAWTGKRYRK